MQRTVDIDLEIRNRDLSDVRVRFFDEAGQSLEMWSGSLPMRGYPVSPDAVRWQLSAGPETDGAVLEEPEGLNDSGMIGLMGMWLLAGGPVEPDPFGQTTHYVVTAHAPERCKAERLLQDLLEAVQRNDSASLPRGVYRIHQLYQTRIEDRNVVCTHVGSAPFVGVAVELNGTPDYVTLDDATLSQDGSIHRAILRIPLTAFHLQGLPGTTLHNQYTMHIQNTGQRRVQVSGGWCTSVL